MTSCLSFEPAQTVTMKNPARWSSASKGEFMHVKLLTSVHVS